jgi:hypothetical protein
VKSNKLSRVPLKSNKAAEPLLIELTPRAIANLEMLQLHSLDKRGRQPAPSEIIEKLINAAAVNGSDAPYPA